MAQVLLVHGDSQASPAQSLTDAGFEVVHFSSGEDAVRHARENNVDAIVIDLQAADRNGKQACRRLRSIVEAPILALTEISEQGDVDDGHEDGADDYLTKPCDGAVVAARLRVLLRRLARRPDGGPTLQVRDLTIDQERLQVHKAGRVINLTPTQFRMLHSLARNAGRVMTSLELLREAQGYECDDQEAQEIVKVHISHLRQKIEPDPSNPVYLLNVRGFGYMLERRTRPS